MGDEEEEEEEEEDDDDDDELVRRGQRDNSAPTRGRDTVAHNG